MTDPKESEVARQLAGKTGDPGTSTEHIRLLVDAKAAAEILSLGARTLWSLTNCGAIPSRRIGRLVRYCPRELSAWVEAGCPTAPGAGDRLRKAAGR
jgi:predicted DNA-binding transcriptional regulator AlpA